MGHSFERRPTQPFRSGWAKKQAARHPVAGWEAPIIERCWNHGVEVFRVVDFSQRAAQAPRRNIGVSRSLPRRSTIFMAITLTGGKAIGRRGRLNDSRSLTISLIGWCLYMRSWVDLSLAFFRVQTTAPGRRVP